MAKADFEIKRGDLLPVIQATLRQENDKGEMVVIDLRTAISVHFILRNMGTNQLKTRALADILDAINGVVRYNWVTADTNTVGNYRCEWEILWPGSPTSKPQTVPTDSYNTVDILQDLDNA
jgi:hypothetical protein